MLAAGRGLVKIIPLCGGEVAVNQQVRHRSEDVLLHIWIVCPGAGPSTFLHATATIHSSGFVRGYTSPVATDPAEAARIFDMPRVD
jgi:hypothetical protein